MRILSLDLGVRSLGSCVSDPNNIIAIPVENFIFKRENYDLALQRVLELIKEYNIGLVLLGYPLRTDGTKSDATIMSENFYERLKLILDIEIKLFDERFSTKRGMELLKNKYKDPRKRADNKDMAAAYVMLIDYLSFNNGEL